MQRLESLESILNPLKKGSKLENTQEWAENQPMDALIQVSSQMYDSAQSPLEWKPSDSPEFSGMPEALTPDADSNAAKDDSYQSLSINTDIPKVLPNPLQKANHHVVPSMPAGIHLGIEEEFELSLIRLGLQYCTITTNFRLSLLLGENHHLHLKGIHQCLRLALCAHGLFFSTHPYIESNLLSVIPSAPKDKILADLVSEYLQQAQKMIPQKPMTEMELIDSVRALMVIVAGYFALGKSKEGSLAKGQINRLVKKWHLFDPFIFNPVPPPRGPSVDSLRVDYGNPIEEFQPPMLSEVEIKERFSLWEECMAIDTFSATVSGSDFDFDETEYPSVFHNPGLSSSETLNLDLSRTFSNPITMPMSARNSIWGNTPFARSFDEIREMTAVSALHFSSGLVHYRLAIIRIARRAIRYARESAKGTNQRFPNDSLHSIHGMFIGHLESLPKSFMPFHSLADFAVRMDHAALSSNWKNHVSFHHDLMIFLGSLTYIHLPNINSTSTYPLSSLSPEGFTSKEILITLLKALVSMIQVLYTTESFDSASPPPTDPPAPGLATMQSAVSLYLIASAALLAGRALNNHQKQVEVEQLIAVWVSPALHRIGSVMPHGKKYYEKLQSLLRGSPHPPQMVSMLIPPATNGSMSYF
ncbi:hypothetical protein HDU91_001982 [Kappamyces sp. JEL0680]|nr:hypothetical protein HDU91_001982 [Kappamyces sp. JEL0680]